MDFGRREITIRLGKGGKDRRTVLPLTLAVPLKLQVDMARTFDDADRAAACSGVMLPDALERKYSGAGMQCSWYWVFPSDDNSTHPRSGVVRRHYMFEQTLQRAIKQAIKVA